MPNGITAYAAYLPRHRLDRQAIAEALELGAGRGARVVASYDEDSTTLAVEAARRLLDAQPPSSVLLATTTPAYLDKANSSALHAALGLGHEGFAADLAGSPRSALAALRMAQATQALAVLSDIRTGLPGSAEERDGADGAAAFRFGPDAAVELVAEASLTAELLDRWRVPGELASRHWEERFALESYLPLIRQAGAAALERAGIEEVDHLVVSSPHARAAASAAKELPVRSAAEPLALGYAGAADFGLRLAATLDRAEPGQTILALSAADGADACVLRVNEKIAEARRGVAVHDQLDGGRAVSYARFLTWRGLLEREPPRRPEPDRPAGPPAARSEAWKFAFVGSRCSACGQVHLPPRRVCVACAAVDEMQDAPLSDHAGAIATFTVDRLAFSPSPPMIDAVVDFDGGGRYTLEVADAAAEEIEIGTRVELTFRRLYTTEGVHNYFWKARPAIGQ